MASNDEKEKEEEMCVICQCKDSQVDKGEAKVYFKESKFYCPSTDKHFAHTYCAADWFVGGNAKCMLCSELVPVKYWNDHVNDVYETLCGMAFLLVLFPER